MLQGLLVILKNFKAAPQLSTMVYIVHVVRNSIDVVTTADITHNYIQKGLCVCNRESPRVGIMRGY